MAIDWQPVYLSIKVAVLSLLIVLVIATATAYFMDRKHFAGKDFVESLITLPLVLPPVVTGFVLLLLIGKNGPIGHFFTEYLQIQIVFTPIAAVLAGVVIAFPLMYQSAKAAFHTVDIHLEEAAKTLGASEIRVFFTVTLPLALHGLVAGAVLSFARALGEFGATIMIAGNIPGKTQTLPLAIYFASESNDLETAGIYVAIICVITFVAIYWLNSWTRAKNKKAQRKERCTC